MVCFVVCRWGLRLLIDRERIYSFDIFYAGFKANTLSREEGRRYRCTVLERGGSQSEMQTLKEYLGREPSNVAFCDELSVEFD